MSKKRNRYTKFDGGSLGVRLSKPVFSLIKERASEKGVTPSAVGRLAIEFVFRPQLLCDSLEHDSLETLEKIENIEQLEKQYIDYLEELNGLATLLNDQLQKLSKKRESLAKEWYKDADKKQKRLNKLTQGLLKKQSEKAGK